ncbi:MAG: N-acetyl-gamma-glutamyl-phosphate reductase, partial [Acidimicrobiales bacterium]
DPYRVLADAYAGEPFVVVSERPPSTKATLGSNAAMLTARTDPRTGWVLVLCALDNLTKGAAGQAIQCANVTLGLPETTGLPTVGVYP